MTRTGLLRAGLPVLCLLAVSPVWALDPAKSISQYILNHWQANEGLSQSTVQALAQTRDGHLWLGTRDGLVRFDGVSFTVYQTRNTPAITHNNISDLAADPDGSLWIGTSEGGVVRWHDGVFDPVLLNVPRSQSIRSLLLTADRTLWIGTYGAGVIRYRNGQALAFTTGQGLANNIVRALAPAHGGGIWVGTDRGLRRIVNESVVGAGDGDPGPVMVNALYDDPAEGLWIGTGDKGAFLLRGGRARRFDEGDGLCGRTVRNIRKDRDGMVWIATSGGLNRWRHGRLEGFTQVDGLSHNYVRSLFEDAEGALWIGLFGGGLARLKDSRFTNITSAQGLSDEFAFCVFESRDGSMWVGTQEGGVNRIVGRRIHAYTTRDGLPSNAVLSLAQSHDGTMWIGTAGGLASFTGGVFRRWGPVDGLELHTVQQIAQAPDGTIWAAGDPGLAHYDGRNWTTYPTPDPEPVWRVLTTIVFDSDGSLTVGGKRGLYRFRDGVFAPIQLADGEPEPKVHSIYRDSKGTLWIATNGAGVYRLAGKQLTHFSTRNGLLDDILYAIIEDDLGNLWFTSNHGVFGARKEVMDDFAAGRTSQVDYSLYDISDGMSSSECNGGGGGYPGAWRSKDRRLWFPTVRGVSVMEPSRVSARTEPLPVVIESVTFARGQYLSDGKARLPAGGGDVRIDYGGYTLLAPNHISFSYKLEPFDSEWVDARNRRSAFYTRLPPGDYHFRVRARGRERAGAPAETSCVLVVPRLFYQTSWFFVLVAAVCGLMLYWVVRVREHRIRAHESAEALRMANAELEERVARRTAELAAANEGLRAEMAERHRAESALRLTQSSVDHASIATIWTHSDGTILRVNRAALEILGYEEQDLLGMNVMRLEAEVESKPFADMRNSLRRHGKATFETRCSTSDGRLVPVEVSVNRIEFEGRVYYLLFARDVTERKRLEAQLGQMQKMDAIGRLAGGIAHDFNNLLTVINGYSRMSLQSLPPGDPLHKRIGHILEAGERASSLTAQLMTFSRKQVHQSKLLDLNPVVRDVANLLRRLIREDIELVCTTSGDRALVKADATQIQQVVMNLCLNARDAIPGSGRIVLQTTTVSLDSPAGTGTGDEVPPGPYVVLSVNDNGVGMDEYVLRHLFEPFFTTKEQGKGTGLGLSTVFGAVRQNSGFITVASQTSAGTTIRVYLPHCDQASAQPQTLEPPEAEIARGNASILLVEDEPQVRELVRTILEGSGYRVREAADADAALRIAHAAASPFDLLVTDIVMPGLSGANLARRLRETAPDTPVLFMSGHTMSHVSETDLELPATAFLQKPFSAQGLSEKVRCLLETSG